MAAHAEGKPLLRGWSHLIAFVAALVAGVVLISSAPSGKPTAYTAIYVASLCTLFGVSALYHRPNWSLPARAVMRRLDHSAIFILIAGTFTPYSLAVPEPHGTALMAIGWGGATVGLLRSLLWPHAPKFVVAACYLALGWAPLFIGRPLLDGLGPDGLFWSAAGGLLYSAGALCYALKHPSLWPRVCGYHEVLHLFVILAAGCHFYAVVLVLRKIS